jgi:HEAT repeat protein
MKNITFFMILVVFLTGCIPFPVKMETPFATNSPEIQYWMDKLMHGGLDDKDQAIKVFKELGAPGTDALIAALKNKDDVVRIYAARTLWKIADPRAVDALLVSMSDDCPNVGELSIMALYSIGEPSVEPLLAILNDKSSKQRCSAAYALGRKDPRVVEPLIAALKNGSQCLRVYSARSLGSTKDPRAVEPLIEALNDIDVGVRIQAVESLGRIGDSRAVEPLIPKLVEKDYALRREAARALAGMQDDRKVQPLLALLRSEDFPAIKGAYGFYIDVGIEGTEYILIRILERNLDDFKIARAFYYSGNSVLEEAGRVWAMDNGMSAELEGSDNPGFIWGSYKYK